MAVTVDDFTIHLPTEMRRITLRCRITGRRRAGARLLLGAMVMRLAAWVAGCGIEISTEDEHG